MADERQRPADPGAEAAAPKRRSPEEVLEQLRREATPAGRSGAGGGAEMSRRDFLRFGLFGTAVLFLAQVAGSFVFYFWPRKVGAFGGRIRVGHFSKFPPGSVTKVEAGKFYLVHIPGDGLIAVYWRCTHLGCTVPWKPEMHRDKGGCFCCNCHGSQFAPSGEYIAGPAPRPLDYMPVTIDQRGDVWVDTGQIIQRARYEPGQATPVPTA